MKIKLSMLMPFSMKCLMVVMILSLPFLSVAQRSQRDSSAVYIEEMPEYPGGNSELMKFLAKSLHYPAAARELNIQGRVVTQFVVNEDGTITDVRIVDSLGCGCDEEAVRVIKLMQPWKPGTQNGVPVKVYFKMPITFKLSYTDYSVTNPGTRNAYFPGGAKELRKYLEKNIIYPSEAKRNHVQGDVEVTFTVLKDGAIGNIEIIKSLGSGCDEEVIRVIHSMPPWRPAYKNCEVQETQINLSVHFPPN